MDISEPFNCVLSFDTRVSRKTGKEYEAVVLSFPDVDKQVIIGFGDLRRTILYALYVPDSEKEVKK